jgi:hypothetical protein
MRASEAAIGGNANSATGIDAGNNRHLRRQNSPVMRVARALWPRKTAQVFAEKTDVTLRQAERVVSGHTGISHSTFMLLLHSEDGFAFLEAEMEGRGPLPAWWEGFRYQVRAALLQAEIAEARSRFNGLKRKRNGLSARSG